MGMHSRRTGYAWLEFGRVADDGQAHYLTLGAGLSAVEGKSQVDCWYFIIEAALHAPRINQDLWLTSEQRVVLTKERLREILQGRGQVFETARSSSPRRGRAPVPPRPAAYDALMDTLIQLRQPQLSKKPRRGSPVRCAERGPAAAFSGSRQRRGRRDGPIGGGPPPAGGVPDACQGGGTVRAALSTLRRHAQPARGGPLRALHRRSTTTPAAPATRRRRCWRRRSWPRRAPRRLTRRPSWR